MAVSLDELSHNLAQALKQAPMRTEDNDGVGFLYAKGEACVHIAIYPEDINTSAGPTESAELILTFCHETGAPLNLKGLADDVLVKLLSTLLSAAVWGKVEAHVDGEELTVLIHYRYIRLCQEDIEPIDGDYALMPLLCEIGVMHDEWLQLNNLLSVIMSGDEDIEEKVGLLLMPPEGSRQ